VSDLVFLVRGRAEIEGFENMVLKEIFGLRREEVRGV
jgi:hypothetical protein